ncbi:hypothetical protein GF376_01910 [Candidatus Peregrinibacteria bacterium]|nr:hypothetical protein [Candidatus Peregrinibacteria bacterium]
MQKQIFSRRFSRFFGILAVIAFFVPSMVSAQATTDYCTTSKTKVRPGSPVIYTLKNDNYYGTSIIDFSIDSTNQNANCGTPSVDSANNEITLTCVYYDEGSFTQGYTFQPPVSDTDAISYDCPSVIVESEYTDQCSVSDTSVEVGDTVTFTIPEDGTYTVYEFVDEENPIADCGSQNGNKLECEFTDEGTFKQRYWSRPNNYNTMWSCFDVTVSAATPDPSPSPTPTPDNEPEITNASASPNSFDPNKEDTNISFRLSDDANVSLYIYDGSRLIDTILNDVDLSSGYHDYDWDGRYSNGNIVEEGSYEFDLFVDNVNGVDREEGVIKVVYEEEDDDNNNTDQCAGFDDVPADSPDCDAIEYVKSIGAMTGTDSGDFEPNERLQRDQIAKIVLEAFDKFDSGRDYCDGRPFPDLSSRDWSYEYVCRARNLGIITGYKSGPNAGLFKPANEVSRVEFLAMVLRNKSFSPGSRNYFDAADRQWYSDYTAYSYRYQLFPGTNLGLNAPVKRIEVARILKELDDIGYL